MKKNAKKFFLFVLITFFIALLYIWEQTESKIFLRKLNEIYKQKDEEIEKNSKLQIKLAELKSPERLNEIAKKMNFTVPEEDAIIYLK